MEVIDFLLGMCTGGMAMLIAVLRVIANLHDRTKRDRWRR